MDIRFTRTTDEGRNVTVEMSIEDAKTLADDIESCMHRSPPHSPGATIRARLDTFARLLRLADSTRSQPATYKNHTSFMEMTDPEGLSASDAASPTSAMTKVPSVIPDAHIEWAVRIYKVDSFGKPSENESLAKTYKKEDRAKAALFFERTQNVHNAKVRNHESPGYLVLFGMQDSRKHKKAGSFQELERALCKG